MKNRLRTYTITAASGILLACGITDEAPKSENVAVTTIDATSVGALRDNEQLILDVREHDAVYNFDQRESAIDFSRISVICPNGAAMPMTDWLRNFAAEQNTPLYAQRDFALTGGIDLEVPPTAPPGTDCLYLCRICPDGARVCRWTCDGSDDAEDWRLWERRRRGATPPPPGAEVPDTAPGVPPDPEPPVDPSPSGGGSSGGGGGGSPGGGGSSGGGSSGGGSSGGGGSTSGGGSTNGGGGGGSAGGASSPGGGW